MTLSTYIHDSLVNERLRINNSTKSVRAKHTLFPKNKYELKKIIKDELEQQGPDADFNHIDTSKITDMSMLFALTNIGNIKLDQWDVSNVTNMDRMFSGCKNFNGDVSSWDVSKVISTADFNYGSALQDVNKLSKQLRQLNERLHISSNTKSVSQPKPTTKEELRSIIEQELERQGPDADLNHIDVSNITNMSSLFYGLWHIGNIKIDEWDVSNVENMSNMFFECAKFTGRSTSPDGVTCDLSNWDVSNVTNMFEMFCSCKNFESDLSKWNVAKVKDMTGMFQDCKRFESDLSRWDVSSIEYNNSIFNGCTRMRKNKLFQPKFH